MLFNYATMNKYDATSLNLGTMADTAAAFQMISTIPLLLLMLLLLLLLLLMLLLLLLALMLLLKPLQLQTIPSVGLAVPLCLLCSTSTSIVQDPAPPGFLRRWKGSGEGQGILGRDSWPDSPHDSTAILTEFDVKGFF